jgi:F0F1-type ATP synthase membrane subunit b/b'
MNKRLILGVTVFYVIGILLGIILFRSPGFSKAYLEVYGEEHDRYNAIIKTEEFKSHEERPLLHPLHGKLEEDFKFVEEYSERPAFIHEEERIWWFVEYFKVLNAVVFISYIVGFARKPLLSYLDDQIKQIKQNLDDAAKARQEAAVLKGHVAEKTEGWAQTEAKILAEADLTVARHREIIESEAKDAAAVLAKQTAERKQAELYAAARTIKTEMVTEAIQRLEDRYKNELTLEKLTLNVDHFVNLMERLS